MQIFILSLHLILFYKKTFYISVWHK